MGTLFVVSTPIGNLEDITLRALRVLREVSLIAAEDTRHTRKLLNHFSIATATVSYHQHSAPTRTHEILESLGQGDVALVTDAGTPGISDPGGELVAAAAEAGFPVVPIPGASAVLALVASSGLPASRFAYLGFLPRKGREREALVAEAARTGWPFVVYESPGRLAATLAYLRERVGSNRQVVVGRELTKLHEELFRGTLHGAETHFAGRHVRGEVTLMVGPTLAGVSDAMKSNVDLDHALAETLAEGLAGRQAARRAAELAGVSTREAYNRLLEMRAARGETGERE